MASSLPIPPQASRAPSPENDRINGHSNVDVTNNGSGSVCVGDNNERNQGIIGDGSHNIVNLGNIDLKMGAEGELESILGPYVSRDALHDSWNAPPECHEGTRKTALKAIEDWIENSGSNASPILWLYGPAGVGKSVIAKTVAGLTNKVVATFFFSTSSDRTAATLFPTLAWQLAYNIPDTKQHIVDALKNRCLPQTSQIEQQFNLLITEPLRKSKTAMESTSGGIIMIIDGVDECTDEDMRTRFLKVLERSGNKGDMQLRFLICSRPEPGICDVLDKTYEDQLPTVQPTDTSGGPSISTLDSHHDPSPSQQRRALCLRLREYVEPYVPDIKGHLNSLKEWRPHHAAELVQEVRKLYRALPHGEVKVHLLPEPSDELDEISPHRVISRLQIGLSPESEKDIQKYLNDKFTEINQQRPNLGKWFELDTVQRLSKISCGQFLYASTIIRLLDDHDFYPTDVLEMALSSSSPSPDMDKLYEEILKRAQTDALTDILMILAVFSENVHFANIRNTFPIIESLLDLQKGRLTTKLNKMHSLLRIVPGRSVNVYHRSFLEFLQNENRSGIHYIPYQAALRRFLVLLRKALFRYAFTGLRRQLSDDDRENSESLRDMVTAFPRNFFKLSNNPSTLASFHAIAHSLPVILVWAVLCWSTSPFWSPIIFSLPLSAVGKYFLRYILILLSFFVLSYSSFLLSLTYYESQLRRCIICPFFHPFLHPHFVKSAELLFDLRPFHVLPLLFALAFIVISLTSHYYGVLFSR